MILEIEILKLKINPFHSKIYKTNDIESLIESIKEHGQLVPIVVNKEYVIISGYRRFLALKELGIAIVKVEINECDEKDEDLLISFNDQRIKTNRELLTEASKLKRNLGLKAGRPPLDEKCENKLPVDTRKKICDIIGISEGNLSKLQFIEERRPDLIEEIDKGSISINQAHIALKKKEEEKKMLNMDLILPTTITSDYYTIFNKSSDDLSDIKDESIQTIITSPPYIWKRNYSDNVNELGSEKTSEEYVQRMANHLHKCYRVLKNEGSFFLNMGDSYRNKNLQFIPHRLVLELVKKGWRARQTIIWHKSNTLPSTVKDGLTNSFEYMFHLVKSHSYYYNQILVPKMTPVHEGVSIIRKKSQNGNLSDYAKVFINGLKDGKNLEDYWTEDIVTTACATQSISKKYGGTDHPAPFPAEIVTLPILQTSRPGDIVMDLFSGTGTTGAVAIMLGRQYVGYELNPNHNDIQKRRLDDAIKTYNEAQMPNNLSQAA